MRALLGLSEMVTNVNLPNVARNIYARVGAEDCFRYIEGPEGHRYYADLSWPMVHELFD